MPRPKSPCGTYPAYQRHLREGSPVDEACRRAQREHDAGRGKALRARDVERPLLTPAPSKLEQLVKRGDVLQARYLGRLAALAAAGREDDLYRVIDLAAEAENLLDEWIGVADDIDYERGYPELSEELRAQLLASREG